MNISNIFCYIFGEITFFSKIKFILLCILCYKMEIAEEGKFYNPFSFQQTKNIKGILSIVIFIYHFYFAVLNNDNYYYIPFSDYGYKIVSIFFFYSGYGIMKKYLTTKNYLKGFLRKRLISVLIPFYLINTTLSVLYYFTGNKYLNTENLIRKKEKNIKIIIFTLLGITPAYEIGWYSIAISVLYISFYLSFRFIKYHNLNFIIIFIFLCSTIYYVNIKRDRHYCFQGFGYIKSHFPFLFGLIIAKYENIILNKIKKYHSFSLLLFLYFRFYFIDYYRDFIRYLKKKKLSLEEPKFYIKSAIIYNLHCIMSVIVVHLILMKIYFHNKILDYLGKISYEIYLYHFFGLKLLRSELYYIQSDRFYVLMCFCWTIIIPILMNYVDSFLINLGLKIAFCKLNSDKKKGKNQYFAVKNELNQNNEKKNENF